MKRHSATMVLTLIGLLCCQSGRGVTREAIPIEFFFTEGCDTCQRVEHEIVPQLETYYAGLYDLVRYDIDIMTNYLRLAAYQERLPIDPHATSVIVVDRTTPFDTWERIRDQFLDFVGQRVAGVIPAPSVAQPAVDTLSIDRLERRARGFTLAGVAAAGLIDGINPCAISTLVFFISILSVMKISGRRLIWAGAIFCLTSFMTYLAIGFGLFRILYISTSYPILRQALEWGMVAILALLAVLSVIDAFRYRSGHRPDDVMLKLPRRVSDTIHHLIRTGLSTRHILWGSILTAFLVTVLESVCTGQVYVPTLVLVLRNGRSVALVLGYLLLYNLLFILPLVLALIVAYRGIQTAKLVAWSRRNVFPSKLAMAALFVALAVLIAMI